MNICPGFFPVLQQERPLRVPDHRARDGALGGHQGVARGAHHQVSLFGIKKFEILSFFPNLMCLQEHEVHVRGERLGLEREAQEGRDAGGVGLVIQI